MANVMIVDDAMFMRNIIRKILEKNGHRVVGEVSNGKLAIEAYKMCKPDIVTMDFTMPEMSGIDDLKEIKRYDSQAKVIMCSAMGQQSIVIDAIRAGAVDFLVKPFNESRVVDTIKNVQNKR